MYESFDDLWEGLTKNAYAGMEYQPRKFWVGFNVGFLVSVFPPNYLGIALIWALRSPTLCLGRVRFSTPDQPLHGIDPCHTVRHLGLPILYALTLPVACAALT